MRTKNLQLLQETIIVDKISMSKKYEPFLKKALDADHKYVPFDTLNISTVTMGVKLMEHSNIKFHELFDHLPVVPLDIQLQYPGHRWPTGTITCAKFAGKTRGLSPTDSERSFKNATMVWIWLSDKEKTVNVKISGNTLHITGCKTLEQTAQTARLIQCHLETLYDMNGIKFYDSYPYVTEFNVYMINYNFNLEVAMDLPSFDVFISKEFSSTFFSPYDQNIHGTTMPLKCPQMSMTYTLHDNGQICMCVSQSDVQKALVNIIKGHQIFFILLDAFREFQKLQMGA